LGLFTTWEHNTKELSKHFTVFEVKLPDYKDSPRGYDLDDYASAVVALFPRYGIRRPTIVGNSTGGLIAARPDLVSRLVLIASSGLFDETEGFDKLIVRSATAANVDKIMRHIFFDQAFIPRSTIDAVADYFLSNRRVRLKSFMKTARRLRSANLGEELKDIRVPTLLIWGAEDRVIPVSVAHKFHSLIPGSRLVVLDRCGHAPQIEHAATVNQLIIGFNGNGEHIPLDSRLARPETPRVTNAL
jgi:pimeloyl-ACP methyl ester carboxylesterase